jgi:hypothetical protein
MASPSSRICVEFWHLVPGKTYNDMLQSIRTKDALRKGNRASAIARVIIARNRATDILPVVHALQQEGVTILLGIASALNERGIPAPRGGNWSPVQVSRLLAVAKRALPVPHIFCPIDFGGQRNRVY